MMMGFLRHLDVPLLVSEDRPSDEFNPLGYYEYEPVRRLASDAAWLPIARGRAVKIVAPLVGTLPTNEQYRIIYMRRPLDKVILSQESFLGQHADVTRRIELRTAYDTLQTNLLAQLNARPEIDLLEVSFEEACTTPPAVGTRVARFLKLDPNKAQAVASLAFLAELVHHV